VTLHIESIGAGPDLVLIHGWAMHGGIFAPLTPLLAEHFRVHLVDLPGHGFSRDDTESADIDAWTRRLLDATPPALWIGWSLGGLVALTAALSRPRQVRGLVEIAASPRFVNGEDWSLGVDKQVFEQFGAGLQTHFQHAIERFLALETIGSVNAQTELRDLKARVFERGDPNLHVLSAGLDMLDSIDLRARLNELSMPSLWIAGRRDRLVPSAAMQWASRHSVQSEFVEIASGHAPFISYAPEVAAAIVAFATKLTSA
jgi:pimeloyl-[acyl-carrier protein] methyl ester esterase